mmetsp:Transcript_37463/g.105813  ORF Transcript_37463/g.105813 Transcript_37463/m.105813 type:complete len:368 (+) Transcript_37463:55-1158(+)
MLCGFRDRICGAPQAVRPWQPCAIFFDYDDTLFPTESLCGGRDRPPCLEELTPQARAELAALDFAVQSLLRHAVHLAGKHGIVRIVTSAARQWVEETLPRLLPLAAEALHELRICVAASSEPDGAPSYGPWHKAMAFKQGLSELPENMRCVVSVGDGLQERVALHFMAEWQARQGGRHTAAAFKSLQLRQMPPIPSLLEQLRFLRASALADIIRNPECICRADRETTADFYLDPVQLRVCRHPLEEREALWYLVDAMDAESEACCGPSPDGPRSVLSDVLRAMQCGSPFMGCRQQSACCAQCFHKEPLEVEPVYGGDSCGDRGLVYATSPDPEDEWVEMQSYGRAPNQAAPQAWACESMWAGGVSVP